MDGYGGWRVVGGGWTETEEGEVEGGGGLFRIFPLFAKLSESIPARPI